MSIARYTIVLMLLVAAPAYADLIKYTDKDGTLCFVDDLGKVPARYRQNIIRDEEESAAQIIVPDDQARQTSTDRYSEKEPVTVCYGLSSLPAGAGESSGHDISCFLDARKYPYKMLKVTNDPTNTRVCAEYYCRKSKKRIECIENVMKNLESRMPIIVFGDRLLEGDGIDKWKEIDIHFTGKSWMDVKYDHIPGQRNREPRRYSE